MEYTKDTKNSPTKENNFIHNTTCVIVLHLSLLKGEEKREVRVKRCVEVVIRSYGWLQHISWIASCVFHAPMMAAE